MKKIPIILPLLLFGLTACSGGSGGGSSSNDEPSDSNAYAVESAMSSMNTSMNDSEASETVAKASLPRKNYFSWIIPKAYAYSCGFERYSPEINPASNCGGTENDATVIENFDGCNAGNSARVYKEGQIKLAFSDTTTCNEWVNGGSLPASGSMLVTTTNLEAHYGANEFLTSTASHTNYLGETIGGGIDIDFDTSSRSVDINGVHYVGNRVTVGRGTVNFLDYSVSTPTPLTVTGTKRDNNRRITSGTIKIDNNKKEYTMTASANDLTWSADCCYPTGGTLNFVRTGSVTSTLTVNFSASCGEAEFLEGTDRRFLSFNACE